VENLRYPIGKYHAPEIISVEQRATWIADIAALPKLLRTATQNLTPAQLDTPYRSGGWTIRQVVHHTADSHINAYTRFKLALTENNPVIKPYQEGLWANLPDSAEPIDYSLQILDALHHRWVVVLKLMTDGDFSRTYFHPESHLISRLDTILGMYAWHGKHHIAHIVVGIANN
jgi:uncharacterized damage-inducible protein DinB